MGLGNNLRSRLSVQHVYVTLTTTWQADPSITGHSSTPKQLR